jgi:hypothetical protein
MSRRGRPVPLTSSESRFRLGTWLREHGDVVSISGPEWVCECPMCGRGKLAVHVERKVWQCWTCSFKGWSPVLLVSAIAGVPLEHAIQIIAAYAAGQAIGPIAALNSVTFRRPYKLPEAPMPPGTEWAVKGPQRSYLRKRKVPEEHIGLFSLGTVHGDGQRTKANFALKNRIIVPAWNPGGRFVFWVTRAIKDRGPKVVNLPRPCREVGHPANCTCYHSEWGLRPVAGCATANDVVIGLHLVQHGTAVYVVEGPMDAIVCGPGFVSVLGANVSPQQAALIGGSGASEAVILFDGDRQGYRGSLQAATMLSRILPVRVGRLPKDDDPGSIGRHRCIAIAGIARADWQLDPLQTFEPSDEKRRSTRLKPFIGSLN